MAAAPWRALLLLLALSSGAAAQRSAVPLEQAAIYEGPDGLLSVHPGRPAAGALAWGSFEDGLNISGWGILDVRASGSRSDVTQHLAAGMVEGYLTARHIHTTYLDAIGFVFKGNVSTLALTFLADQIAWARAQAKANPDDAFWTHVAAVLAQLDGLVLGYGLAAKQGLVPELPLAAFQILNSVGDLFQIMPAVDELRRPNLHDMTSKELRDWVKHNGMCSGIVKVPGDFEDLFMAHSSWFSYGNTNRIYKHYRFSFRIPAASNRMSFSSYPGFLQSLDDFYMMDSGLGMIQTSNDLLNHSLLELVKPESLLAWQRVRVANAVAKTGEEWYKAFRTHASGTYVNQYMVVDFKLFTPRKALRPGTLWVVEEIPGLVMGEDQTTTLARGYWPSYNIPFYREIYERSGYRDDRLGYDGDYELAPRAKIFRRDQTSVVDMVSLKKLMRYANYSDPYALNEEGEVDYAAAICMRGDLDRSGHGSAGGCYDTKVVSHQHGFWDMEAQIVNGPTSVSSDGTGGRSANKPFEWRGKVDEKTLHWGLPRAYNFDFMATRPKELPCEACEQYAFLVM